MRRRALRERPRLSSNYRKTWNVNGRHAIWDSSGPTVTRQTGQLVAIMHPLQDHIKVEAMEEPVEVVGAVEEEEAAERVGLVTDMVNAVSNMISATTCSR